MTRAKDKEAKKQDEIDEVERRRRRLQSAGDRLEAQRKRSIEWAKDRDVLSRAAFAGVATALRSGGMSLKLFVQMLQGMVEAVSKGLVDTEELWIASLKTMLRNAKYQREKWQEIEKTLSEGIQSTNWAQLAQEIHTLSETIMGESWERAEGLEEFFQRLMEEREWRWSRMQ